MLAGGRGKTDRVLTFLGAVIAACANACASVLQRKANKEIPREEQMSLRLVRDLLRSPAWFGGVAAVTVGFLLQAAALSRGALSVVEPILVLELPITVLLASWAFHGRLGSREWLALSGMTAGLAGLIYVLDPSGGAARSVAWWQWALGLGIAGVALAALVGWGRAAGGAARAGIYGTATGLGFGVTAALMKGMTGALDQGFWHVLAVWPTYAMVVTGAGSMYLLQNAVNAGRLVAAQPGMTLTDPVVSILWGVLLFGERVRHGWWLALAVLGIGLIAASVLGLTRSPLLTDEAGGEEAGAQEDAERAYEAGRPTQPDRARLGA
jgi:drug/metabolite transporter (DMT)-like permease